MRLQRFGLTQQAAGDPAIADGIHPPILAHRLLRAARMEP